MLEGATVDKPVGDPFKPFGVPLEHGGAGVVAAHHHELRLPSFGREFFRGDEQVNGVHTQTGCGLGV